jgi:hypothetical protein
MTIINDTQHNPNTHHDTQHKRKKLRYVKMYWYVQHRCAESVTLPFTSVSGKGTPPNMWTSLSFGERNSVGTGFSGVGYPSFRQFY